MTCEEAQHLMSVFLDGLLNQDEEQDLQGHLAGCQRCGSDMATMEEAMALVRTLAQEMLEAPVGFKEDVMQSLDLPPARQRGRRSMGKRNWWSLAAAAVLVMVAWWSLAGPGPGGGVGGSSGTSMLAEAPGQGDLSKQATPESETKSRQAASQKAAVEGTAGQPAAPARQDEMAPTEKRDGASPGEEYLAQRASPPAKDQAAGVTGGATGGTAPSPAEQPPQVFSMVTPEKAGVEKRRRVNLVLASPTDPSQALQNLALKANATIYSDAEGQWRLLLLPANEATLLEAITTLGKIMERQEDLVDMGPQLAAAREQVSKLYQQKQRSAGTVDNSQGEAIRQAEAKLAELENLMNQVEVVVTWRNQ